MSTPPEQQAAWDNFTHRWDVFTDVPTIIDEKFEDGRELAQSAIREAKVTIEALRDAANELNEIDTGAVLASISPPDVGTFTASAPTAPSIVAAFPTAPTGTSEMENAVQDKLRDDLNNDSPAITDTVRDAILAKGEETSELILQDTLDKISDEWSRRKFSLPNGMLAANLSRAIIEHGNKRLDINRDVTIKNLELTDANMKFAIQQGIAYLLQRVEIYKSEITAEAARIDAIVRKYLGEVEVYRGTAQVYTALADVNIRQFEADLKYETIRAQLLIENAKIDVENYKASVGLKVEAMKAIGSINAQMVAGALSSVNASVTMSASNSADYRYNYGVTADAD